ncbi:hypothetical protein AAY81_04100 [Denitrobacterium detoxificans]|uniref:Site-specific recombinase XerC n=1 Tax=Denitrobacterium detoxificans TaxID=79604 RepID=A0A172RXI9_9ACTN|nr:site-specific integrase [Denitrobacterium detoxificans]ANE22438.1 hypothetical protein AAY81_04100 [Denitrobacterium detoxificans]SEO81311.1 Site-specific recombinase XerC [Denitrobacterium detoxificans]SEP01372.1 Site-specific recombinase XerC [Denitrobacterium detoxificans]
MRSVEGSVVKVGEGRYRVSVELPRDPRTGRRVRRSRTVRGTRREAEAAKRELLEEAGAEPAAMPVTVEEYAEGVYLPAKALEVRATTLVGYRGRLRNHVYPAFGQVELSQVTPQAIRRWLGGFERPATAEEAYRTLSQLMSFAMYDGAIESNPFDRVRRPRRQRYEPVVLDASQMRAYLELFHGTRVEAAVLLAAGCGLRRGEICGLDVDDVDWETGEVRVSGTYIMVDGVPTEEDTKSERSRRTVHMPPQLLGRLRDVSPESGPLLAEDGVRMNPDNVSHEYRRILDASDVEPKVPLKNLRHSSLTLAYDSGARLLDVRDRAGHSSESITARYYVRPKTSGDEEIAEAIGEALVTSRYISGGNPPKDDPVAEFEAELAAVTLESVEHF